MASTIAASTSSLLLHHRLSSHLHRRHNHHHVLHLSPPQFPSLKPLSSFLSSPLRLPFQLHLRLSASAFSGSESESGSESDPTTPSGGGEGGRLYVGNLPYSMTPSQLREVFGQAGPVDAVEVVYDRVTDRSRGFAFVTMAGSDEAREAIRMFDGAQVGGRTVKVNFPEVPRGGERAVMEPRIRGSMRDFVESPHKVYAGNLGWSVTSESLRKAFEGLPGLLGARVIYDRDSGRSRGYGFVSFASPEDAQAAIDSMNAVEVEGRPLRLSLAAERSTASVTSSSASR